MPINLIIIALVAYLLGSIPFGYILVKLFLQQDIRATGSGNIGATNVARSGNKGLAIATLLLDAGKGALAVHLAMLLALRYLRLTDWWYWPDGDHFQVIALLPALAALLAILGHMFPVWLRFNGGKGVATAVGGFALLSPKAILIALAVFVVIFALTRYVSVASIVAALAFPMGYRIVEPQDSRPLVLLVLLTSSLLIVAKHQANIRRLMAGIEPKFGKQAIDTTDPVETEKSI